MAAETMEIHGAGLAGDKRLPGLLADGTVLILRNLAEISHFRAELISCASALVDGPDTAEQLTDLYQRGSNPGLKPLLGLARAVRKALESRFLPQLFWPFVDKAGFPAPVLLDQGVCRLVLPPLLMESARASGLFEDRDFLRPEPTALPEIFMPGPTNIHRDFARPHRVFMSNLWFPLHDAGSDNILQIFAKEYRGAAMNMDNTPVTVARLRPALAVELRFGDALLFHGEHLHASPPPTARRHSFELRIAASCPDDNGHYRPNFSPIENFVTRSRTPPPLGEDYESELAYADHYRVHGPTISANFYRNCARQRKALTLIDVQEIERVFDNYPFAADRYMDLALICKPLSSKYAGQILSKAAARANGYYWKMRCAELIAGLGLSSEARRIYKEALALVPVTPEPPDFAPVTYQEQPTQVLPQQAGAVMGRRLAEMRLYRVKSVIRRLAGVRPGNIGSTVKWLGTRILRALVGRGE